MKLYKPAIEKDRHGGTQKIYKFDNGFGASVIRTEYSYGSEDGLWELAVIRFLGDVEKFEIVYDTGITDDVIGDLTPGGVEQELEKIEKLKANK